MTRPNGSSGCSALLQQRPVWTGPELADRLGVTTRSVRRDVERLRALGYPVNATQGVGGGYQLGRGHGPAAAAARRRGGDRHRRLAPPRRRRHGRRGQRGRGRTLAKLDQVLPARLRAEVRAVHDAITTLEGGRVEVDADALLALARAARDRLRVELTYTAAGASRP